MKKINANTDLHFSLLISFIFTILAIYPLFNGQDMRLWAAIIAIVTLLIGLLRPSLLTPVTRLWLKFGMLLHIIISPLIMGLIYISTVIPTGVLLKLFRKDPMQRKFESTNETYWIMRESSDLEKNSLKNQF